MWQRTRHRRVLAKINHRAMIYLHTRELTQWRALLRHPLISRTPKSWFVCHQDTLKQLRLAGSRRHCLSSGRSRGVSKAFRETRMATRDSLFTNTLSHIKPNTK